MSAPPALRAVPPPALGDMSQSVLAPGWIGPSVRADDIEFVPLDDAPLEGAMAIVGVSSIGSVGSLVARYLISRLEMDLIGAFYSERTLPAGASHHGIVTSAVQVWRAEVACGLDGQCSHLLVVKNDLPVDMPFMAPLSLAIARWAAKSKLSLLVACESYPRVEQEDRDVLVATSGPARDLAARVPAKPLDDAIVIGFDAALLASANRERVRAVVFFGPHEHPDGDSQAAAAALRAARPLLPELGLADADVDHELRRLEAELKRQVNAAMGRGRLGRGFKGYA